MSSRANQAAGWPSIAASTSVAPRCRAASASAGSANAANSSMNARLPTATCRPSTSPQMPRPTAACTCVAAGTASPRSAAACSKAFARACSLAASTAATSRSTASGESAEAGSCWPSLPLAASCGFPSVRVPVLSKITVSATARACIAADERARIPERAPRPTATVIESGVARPSPHGQAITSTLTADTIPIESPCSPPNTSQPTSVINAASTTAGTTRAEMRSASC